MWETTQGRKLRMKNQFHWNANDLLLLHKVHECISWQKYTYLCKISNKRASVALLSPQVCRYSLISSTHAHPHSSVVLSSLIHMCLSSPRHSLIPLIAYTLLSFGEKIITKMTLCMSKWINPSNARFLSKWWKAQKRAVWGEDEGQSVQGANHI